MSKLRDVTEPSWSQASFVSEQIYTYRRSVQTQTDPWERPVALTCQHSSLIVVAGAVKSQVQYLKSTQLLFTTHQKYMKAETREPDSHRRVNFDPSCIKAIELDGGTRTGVTKRGDQKNLEDLISVRAVRALSWTGQSVTPWEGPSADWSMTL